MYVIKKDGTREEFNVDKIIAAVNKSAARILYEFRQMRSHLSVSLHMTGRSPLKKTGSRSRRCTTLSKVLSRESIRQ